MIKPEYFHTRTERIRFRSGEQFIVQRVDLQFIVQEIASSPSEIIQLEARAKAKLWEEIYGDLEREIAALRHTVLMNIGQPGGFWPVNAALDKVRALVRNPFQ